MNAGPRVLGSLEFAVEPLSDCRLGSRQSGHKYGPGSSINRNPFVRHNSMTNRLTSQLGRELVHKLSGQGIGIYTYTRVRNITDSAHVLGMGTTDLKIPVQITIDCF